MSFDLVFDDLNDLKCEEGTRKVWLELQADPTAENGDQKLFRGFGFCLDS